MTTPQPGIPPMTSSLPTEHIERPSSPQHPQRITECGLPVTGNDVVNPNQWAIRIRHRGYDHALVGVCPDCVAATERLSNQSNPMVARPSCNSDGPVTQ